MNDPFLISNTEFLAQQDYLSMLRSPTYINCQPSPFEEYTVMKPSTSDAEDPVELKPMLESSKAIIDSSSQLRILQVPYLFYIYK